MLSDGFEQSWRKRGESCGSEEVVSCRDVMLRDVYVERIACRGTCRALGARGECARLVRARGAQSLATSLRADAARTAAVVGRWYMVTANIVQLRGGALVHDLLTES